MHFVLSVEEVFYLFLSLMNIGFVRTAVETVLTIYRIVVW